MVEEEVLLDFTVIVHLYFLPRTVAVIVHLPAFFAVTTPFLDTDATAVLELFQVTACVVPLTESWTFFPAYKVLELAEMAGVSTVTLQRYFFVPIFAVMVTEPFFKAVTTPLLETVAMDF